MDVFILVVGERLFGSERLRDYDNDRTTDVGGYSWRRYGDGECSYVSDSIV